MPWLPKIWLDTKMYFPNMPGRALKVCGGAARDYILINYNSLLYAFATKNMVRYQNVLS